MPDGGRPGPSVQSPDGPRTRKRIRERRRRIGTTIPLLCLLFCMDCSDLLVLPRLSQYYTAVQIANRHWKQAFHSAELPYRSSGTGILSTVHIMDEQHPAGESRSQKSGSAAAVGAYRSASMETNANVFSVQPLKVSGKYPLWIIAFSG